MRQEEVIQTFRMMGFNFNDDTNTVSNDKKVFARLENQMLISFDHTPLSVEDVTSITLNQLTGQMILLLVDGSNIQICGKGRRLANTLKELMDVLPFIAPDINRHMYYDEMSGRDIVCTKLWLEEPFIAKKAEDVDISKFRYLIETGCEKYGFKYCFSRDTRMDAWVIICDKNKRNPWCEWLEGLVWDGKPRLRRWFIENLGATAPPLVSIEKDEFYLEEVTQAWFMGAVHRAYKETKHEVVPVLIGAQGVGKSEFIRYTAYADEWYKDTISKFEDEKTFREKTEGAKLIELAESKQLRTTGVEELKMFISKSSDTYRESYGRKSRDFRRHWILIATSNDSKLFVDKTGNRRFFPMFCDISCATKNYMEDTTRHEAEQVWAEAYQIYKSGALCKFDRDSEVVKLSEIMQSNSTYEDDTWNAIDAYLDDPEREYCLKGSMISKVEIFENILDVDGRKPPDKVRYSVNSWMENNGKWVNEQVKWYNGKTTRNVMVRKEDAIVCNISDETIANMYRRFVEDNNISTYEPARLEDFMRARNINLSIFKICAVLKKESLIFERGGLFYLL